MKNTFRSCDPVPMKITITMMRLGVVRKLDFRKLENINSNFIKIKNMYKVRNGKNLNSNF
jgi:hypothetical protein